MFCASCYHLYNLKNVKTPIEEYFFLVHATLLKVTLLHECFATLLKVALLHMCFSRFLNSANVTKSRNASQIVI